MTDILGPNPADFVARNGKRVRSIKTIDGEIYVWRVTYEDGNTETVTRNGKVFSDGTSDYDLLPWSNGLAARIAETEAALAKLKAEYERSQKPKLPIEFREDVDGSSTDFDTLSESGAVCVAYGMALSDELKSRSLVVKPEYRVELREKNGYTHILIWPKDVE